QCGAWARGIGGLGRDVAWAGGVGLRQWPWVRTDRAARAPAAKPPDRAPALRPPGSFLRTRIARVSEPPHGIRDPQPHAQQDSWRAGGWGRRAAQDAEGRAAGAPRPRPPGLSAPPPPEVPGPRPAAMSAL
ncbi:hypothetical protein MC885_007998, partial [Smutsia gigantea]